jgi:hypothetical protein
MNKHKCTLGCVYSKAMGQEFPRLCIECGTPETIKVSVQGIISSENLIDECLKPTEASNFVPSIFGPYQASAEPRFSWNEIENCLARILFNKHEMKGDVIFCILMQLKQELGLMPKSEGE